jgi:hypothetical protein
MRRRASKRKALEELEETNLLAGHIVAQATGQQRPQAGKNPAAVALGKLGASKGGKARAAALTKKRRKEIARAAAFSRWTRNLPEVG